MEEPEIKSEIRSALDKINRNKAIRPVGIVIEFLSDLGHGQDHRFNKRNI